MAIKRANFVDIGLVKLQLPTFFLSISSIKTAMLPAEYIKLLFALRAICPNFLVSAFDLAQLPEGSKTELKKILTRAREEGCTVLMDSGNYESFWKDAQTKWMPGNFYQVLKEFSCSFAFGFDDQKPPENFEQHKKSIYEHYKFDQSNANPIPIIPIIHGSPDKLPALCKHIALETRTPMIAVPERRLGEGIFERARTTTAIREKLSDLDRYVALHLLGTGNPISMGIYVIAGADSFDGLEWCQTVVDYDTNCLFHFTQADFFRKQTKWGTENFAFQPRTLAHNVEYFFSWIKGIREATISNSLLNFCRKNFPPHIYDKCVVELGWK